MLTLVQNAHHAIDKVGNVEELDVPTGDDIGIVLRPERNELAQQVNLVLTLVVSNVFPVWGVVAAAEGIVLAVNQDGDCGDFFRGFARFGEPVLRTNFYVEVRNTNVLCVPKYIVGMSVRNEGILVAIITIDGESLNTAISLKEVTRIVDGSRLNWFDIVVV